MSEIDTISDYDVEGKSTTTQKKEIETTKYLEDGSSTEYEESKQYGLAKPKKIIIEAILKND